MKDGMSGLVISVVMVLMAFSSVAPLHADYLDDVGYTDLLSELGGDVPDGTGVIVAQVEAPNSGNYMPDADDDDLEDKAIENVSGISDGVSSHATNVGKYFYGDSLSMAAGISDVHLYNASYWIYIDYLRMSYASGGNPIQPIYDLDNKIVLSSPARVMNHSWVGGDDSINDQALRRVDFVADADESIQVVAVNNGDTQKALVSGAFNSITVGRTDGGHATETVFVDEIYTSGRTCPLLVSPTSPTSYTAPVVAAACALLVETGEDENRISLTDPVATVVTDRSGNSIRTSASSALVKAVLLAGARRVTVNSTDSDITDYRIEEENRTDSGLDARYGAGQLNIYTSYHILTGGEFNCLEDDGAGGGVIGGRGFDVVPVFGGENESSRETNYYFTAEAAQRRLYASLVWHLAVDGGETYSWDGNAELYNLDLFLYDVTNPDVEVLVASSESTEENTENLWTPPDTDSDGVPDDWEVQYGLNYTDAGDAAEDNDGDGLDNGAEYAAGTDNSLPDTDGDGYSDGDEVAAGSDPLNIESTPDGAAVPTAGVFLLWALSVAVLFFGVTKVQGLRLKGSRFDSGKTSKTPEP